MKTGLRTDQSTVRGQDFVLFGQVSLPQPDAKTDVPVSISAITGTMTLRASESSQDVLATSNIAIVDAPTGRFSFTMPTGSIPAGVYWRSTSISIQGSQSSPILIDYGVHTITTAGGP